MKTVGGVVIAKCRVDRTEIEGEIDELLSAKWSTWNTLTNKHCHAIVTTFKLYSSIHGFVMER